MARSPDRFSCPERTLSAVVSWLFRRLLGQSPLERLRRSMPHRHTMGRSQEDYLQNYSASMERSKSLPQFAASREHTQAEKGPEMLRVLGTEHLRFRITCLSREPNGRWPRQDSALLRKWASLLGMVRLLPAAYSLTACRCLSSAGQQQALGDRAAVPFSCAPHLVHRLQTRTPQPKALPSSGQGVCPCGCTRGHGSVAQVDHAPESTIP
jgi:hypothetical protein